MNNLGQFMSPDFLVNKCLNLIKNKGNILEPSFGDGAFDGIDSISNETTKIEIDFKIKFAKTL